METFAPIARSATAHGCHTDGSEERALKQIGAGHTKLRAMASNLRAIASTHTAINRHLGLSNLMIKSSSFWFSGCIQGALLVVRFESARFLKVFSTKLATFQRATSSVFAPSSDALCS